MKISLTSLLLAAGVLLIAGCSSTRIDSGRITAHTFSFINPGKPLSAFPEDQQRVHALVQDAITQNLAGRGITRVESGGDVTVAYLVIAGNNTMTTSLNDYFGIREDTEKLTDKAQEKYTDNRNPNSFAAGTLVIDIIDPKSSWKVLYRDYATRALLRDVSPDAKAERMRQVVEQILGKAKFNQ